jgi:3-oxoacyl-[acyl-carrier-protein] synthase III
MPFIAAFGAYLPSRTVTNEEVAPLLGCTPAWIQGASGIEERRYASAEESVEVMAARAGSNCLEKAAVLPSQIGMLVVASGSAERRFPGPACSIAHALGLRDVPAIDLPMASAGALFGMSLASQVCDKYENILVIAAEKMSAITSQAPIDKNTAILFGDGAGSCLISHGSGILRIVDSVLHCDGNFAQDLQLRFTGPITMNGRSVILQATRRIPAAILEILRRNGKAPCDVASFILHQANQNLLDRVAQALEVPASKVYSNIRRYGNTSSASLLIAAAEWWQARDTCDAGPVCFAAFGAGFSWGAILAETP